MTEREGSASAGDAGETESRFRTIADSTPVMIWMSDHRKAGEWFNRPWLAFTGRTLEDERGDGWATSIHPDDRAVVGRVCGAAFERRESFRLDFRMRRHDGAWRIVEDTGVPRFGTDGRFLGFIGSVVDVTERREAEQRLRTSEERLRLAQAAGGVGLWDWTIATGEVVWSEGYYRVWGIPQSEPPSFAGFLARLDPADRASVEAGIARALETSGPWSAEMRRVLPDGTVRWIVARGEFRADAEGLPERMIGVCFDVTDRKMAELELRESEQRLQLAKEAAGLGVWDWDLADDAITWSPEMYAMLGIPADTPRERLFEAWSAVLHPDDRDRAVAVAKRGAETGEPFTIDARVLAGAGDVRWIRSQAVAVLGADGRPVRLTGINVDVTAEHRVEEDLRREAARLQVAVAERTRERDRLFMLTDDLFAVAGLDGYLRLINPAWTRLLGYTEMELLERPVAELMHPDDLSAAGAVFARLAAGEPLQRFEGRLRRKDGGHIRIAWTAVPEGDAVYAVGRDVTHEREREEALRQAQKMEAVGQLTGGIAHDFNNLLSAVVGAFDLIRRRPDEPERVKRFAEAGLEAAERGARLTGQLLAFARNRNIELRPVVISAVVAGMEDLIARTLGPMVRLTLLPEGTRAALADATQIELAVLNLAINARDAMPEGGDLVIATADRDVADDRSGPMGMVEIAVSDTGSGMTPEVAARAFDPFFTTKGIGKGTGLGLSQVYGIATHVGGTVRIETSPGRGTTVRMLLPGTARPVEDVPSEAARALPHGGRSARVLVVDDDRHVRGVLVATLEALGYEVLEADDGASGLALVEAGAPDLLIVDYAMPGMTGAEVAGLVRARRPDLPVVFASGYADGLAIEEAAGKDAPVLRKPIRLEDLQRAVAEALAARPRPP